MIDKKPNINSLNILFNEYKENYEFVNSEFLNIYTYILDNIEVAFISFNIIYDRCEIIDLFVNKKYRNMGIATKLINEISNDFNIDNITLEVNESNSVAIRLYEKLGFNKVAIRKNYYKNNDGILMLKEVR